jgi:hypothetical protein
METSVEIVLCLSFDLDLNLMIISTFYIYARPRFVVELA